MTIAFVKLDLHEICYSIQWGVNVDSAAFMYGVDRSGFYPSF